MPGNVPISVFNRLRDGSQYWLEEDWRGNLE